MASVKWFDRQESSRTDFCRFGYSKDFDPFQDEYSLASKRSLEITHIAFGATYG